MSDLTIPFHSSLQENLNAKKLSRKASATTNKNRTIIFEQSALGDERQQVPTSPISGKPGDRSNRPTVEAEKSNFENDGRKSYRERRGSDSSMRSTLSCFEEIGSRTSDRQNRWERRAPNSVGKPKNVKIVRKISLNDNQPRKELFEDKEISSSHTKPALESSLLASLKKRQLPISTNKENRTIKKNEPIKKSFSGHLSIKNNGNSALKSSLLSSLRSSDPVNALADTLYEEPLQNSLKASKEASRKPEISNTSDKCLDLEKTEVDTHSTESPLSKEKRTHAYYAKLREDDSKLTSQISEPFTSSIVNSLPKAIPIMGHSKVRYTNGQLRKLISFAVAPVDLAPLQVTEVIQVRKPPSSRVEDANKMKKRHESLQKRPKKSRSHRPESQRSNRIAAPVMEEPVSPLHRSENSWKCAKSFSTDTNTPIGTPLSQIKAVLNKLTREKFEKLTKILCDIPIQTFHTLRILVASVMDKAIEECNFADVYADLCKEIHLRTKDTLWPFVNVVESIGQKQEFYWTTISSMEEDLDGPFPSIQECLHRNGNEALLPDILQSLQRSQTSSLSGVQKNAKGIYYAQHSKLLFIVRKRPDGYYYTQKALREPGEDELLIGTFTSPEGALKEAKNVTLFKRLLILRCQERFEKACIHDKKEALDAGSARTKQLMLGNIRFIGELFKVDMLKQGAVCGCFCQLLGLQLLAREDKKSGWVGQIIRVPAEEDIEALCKMLSTVGKKFDRPETKSIMDVFILRIMELAQDSLNVSSRLRFLLKDVLEMRDHMWEPRRQAMQQMTLDQVRREAQKLQRLGQNAQHGQLIHRRQKCQITSAQLAESSGNLLLRLVPDPSQTELDDAKKLDGVQIGRMKSIIQEYLSILDLNEAILCIGELPQVPSKELSHIAFTEELINTALDSKKDQRQHAVTLLAALYEQNVMEIIVFQRALTHIASTLDDLKIDIPLATQHCAFILGRMILNGCLSLSWTMETALVSTRRSGVAALVFAETLHVMEAEAGEISIIQMIQEERIDVACVLPDDKDISDACVQRYLIENDLTHLFVDEDLDPENVAKLRNSLKEYFNVNDLDELELCVNEYSTLGETDAWKYFVEIAILEALHGTAQICRQVSSMMMLLIDRDLIHSSPLKIAFERVLAEYQDTRLDIPNLGQQLAQLWAPLFSRDILQLHWLYSTISAAQYESDVGYEVIVKLLEALQVYLGVESLGDIAVWWRKHTRDQDFLQTPKAFVFNAEGQSFDSKWNELFEILEK
ncbi:unnamed protein product [Albugo candida]|nr:unnamed protein product [Albugo candida]|eukprot:CCI40050.1 unnamed protein product [Albugo candida]